MLENSSFRRIWGEKTWAMPIRDGLGILRFSQFFCTAVITAISPFWPQLKCGQVKLKKWTFNAEKPPKRRFFWERWSEWQDSNLRHPAPKAGALPTALHPVISLFYPAGRILPNLSGILFSLVYSGFRRFLICFTYSLALLSPLFPGGPAPSVVIYVVKNASRPVFGEDSPMPDRKRFAFQIVCIVTLSRVLCKWFLRRQQLKCWAAIDKE